MCEKTSTRTSNWQTPLWLTDSYLEDVLKKYLKDEKVKVVDVNIKPGTANGENYVSVLSRIKVKYTKKDRNEKTEELALFMKYSHENDPIVAKIMSYYEVYNTEMTMYEEILPQLANILQEMGETEELFAQTVKVDSEKSAIIFEDLTEKHYILADRLKGLDNVHASVAIKKLAVFHAAAVVLNRKLKGKLEKFDHGLFNRHTRAFACVFENLLENCAKFALNCPELGAHYHDKLIKLKPYLGEYCAQAYNNNPKHFSTLCHGDFWINNMMMLYDGQLPEEKSLKNILFIDFQFCNWSSAAVDLCYFLYTSLEPKLQLDIQALDDLVQCYHTALADNLEKVNYQGHIPTLHELQAQLEEAGILALAAATTSLPFMINEQCEDSDVHSLLGDDEKARNFRNKLFENKRIQNNLKVLLPHFDQRGILDVKK